MSGISNFVNINTVILANAGIHTSSPGAVVGIFFSVMLSDFTAAWQLFLGLFFVALVRFAPAGLASL